MVQGSRARHRRVDVRELQAFEEAEGDGEATSFAVGAEARAHARAALRACCVLLRSARATLRARVVCTPAPAPRVSRAALRSRTGGPAQAHDLRCRAQATCCWETTT